MGALLALSMPPRGWWPLAPAGIALLAVALDGAGWKVRLGVGVLAGLVLFGPTLRWLTSFSTPGYVVVLVIEAALFGLGMLLVPARRGGWWLLPAALVLLEAARARFPLNGFPIPSIALSQVNGPLAPAAALGGPLLVVALVGIAGLALAAPLLARHRIVSVSGAALILAAVLLVSTVGFTHRVGELPVAAVQGGGPRGIRAVFTDPQDVTERHFAVSNRIRPGPDLVVWPENVVTTRVPLADSSDARRLGRLAQRLDATVIAGVTLPAGSERFRNLAGAWGPGGRLLGTYDKVHRVPFGEYIPARALFELFTDATTLVPRNAIPGRGPGLLVTPAGKLGIAISYEVFFPDRTRAAVRAGADVLLVPTNASSYTRDVVPATEVAAARMRARETGRALVQAAPTGYSAVITADGRVLTRSALADLALLTARIALRSGMTPYTRTGDWPVIALSVLGLVFSFARLRDHRAADREPGQ